MKEIGYHIFAFFYRIFCHLPRKANSAFLIMTHDGGSEGNVAVVASYMKKYKQTQLVTLRRRDTQFSGKSGIKRAILFFFVKPFQMARAQYVFMDNAFLPMAYLTIRKETTVVQLWHGTGTIKKFGQHVNTGELYELEKRGNRNIDYVIVNSEATRQLYSECFGVELEKVKVLGVPRTDLFFSKQLKQKKQNRFLEEFPDLKDKKLLLYAPTFRDHETDHPRLHLDLEQMMEQLPQEYVLGLRLHPFVAERFEMPKGWGNRVINFSAYSNINTLLMATDVLISDYSSIIFEYCVLDRPMIFYAYDLEEFSDHGRGFYRDYETYVPGPVVKSTKELLQVIKNEAWEKEKLEAFFKEAYQYTDGQSTKRVVSFVCDQNK